MFGIFDFRKPLIILRDPQLIKQLTVKDFDHFENHRMFLDENADEVFGSSLIALRGHKWRHMRATLSPSFTGRKMRSMFELVNDCCADMCAELRRKLQPNPASGSVAAPPLVLEMKETFSRYANDVIASTAFGYRVNSFVDERNPFLVNGRKLINFNNFRSAVKFVAMRMCPQLFKACGLQVFDATVSDFFKRMVMDTIRERQEKGIYRPDMINLLMQLKRGSNVKNAAEMEKADTTIDEKTDVRDGFATADDSTVGPLDPGAKEREWTDNDIVAQCFLFFFAGFDTVSSILSFLAYELAINPDVQQQLYEECHAVQRELLAAGSVTGHLPYDRLQRMQYLDQVVSEALRMWPPAMFTDRECGKAYAYDDGELRFDIEAKTNVWIPITALHHDAKYFHDPQTFMPERFNDENKHTIVPGSYLPFGVGPRNCIGKHFELIITGIVSSYFLYSKQRRDSH